MSMSNVTDRVFLITGASSGIGLATARQAFAAGFRLVLASRTLDKLNAVERQLGDAERVLAVRCDVAEWQDQQNLIDTTLTRFGRLDVVFANAGVGGAKSGFADGEPAFWRAMILTNFYGAALTIRASLASLKESQGHLILAGSLAGRRVHPGSIYSCTKWALTALAESVRQELHGTGVRVTIIEPGRVNTPFFSEPYPDALDADDIARAVMYAVSQPPTVNVNEIVIRPITQQF